MSEAEVRLRIALEKWARSASARIEAADALDALLAEHKEATTAAEARGFERAKAQAAGICDTARALAERECAASHYTRTRLEWRALAVEQKETAERIRAMKDGQ